MATPMPRAPETVTEMARTEQQPSSRISTGFSLKMPLVRIFHLLFFCFISRTPSLDGVIGGERRADAVSDGSAGVRGAGDGVHAVGAAA